MHDETNGLKNSLSERKKLILKALVDAHIALGEPVGSKYLTQNKQIAYSSATIRNEMAELEEMGFLEQPHTSSGRVPSEAGYRFYVDALVDRYRFTKQEIEEMDALLKAKRTELDEILALALRLVSRLTNYTSLALKPRQVRITVSRYDILRLDERTLVLVMLISQTVKTKYIKSNRFIPNEAVLRLSAVLNRMAVNVTAEELTLPMMMEMERRMGEYEYLVTPVIKGVCETISAFDGGELTFDGINRLLSYPDYYDLDRLRELLALFERKEDLLAALSEEANGEESGQVQVYIGRENFVKIMDNSTLVFKTIRENGVPIGAIGVIGPTRMDYSRVIAMIDRMTDAVRDAALGNPYGQDGPASPEE